MAARRIPTILPQLSKEEKMEVQAIYDATGIPRYLEDDTRPFRQPHPMIPKAAFLGGGKTPTAGEITLAHHGILFLDEFMEFKTECIEHSDSHWKMERSISPEMGSTTSFRQTFN